MNAQDYSICPVCMNKGNEPRPIPSAVPRKLGVVENRTHCDDALLYECGGCGRFAITKSDAEDAHDSERWWKDRSRLQVSALLREQTIRPVPPYWLRFGTEPYGPLEWTGVTRIDVDELLKRWPRTVPERLDRMLCNLASLSPTGGQPIPMHASDLSLAFAQTVEEAFFHRRCLVDRGDLVASESAMREKCVSLSAEGWERFEELTQGQSAPENEVFVAMWFGAQEKKNDDDKTKEEMDRLYSVGIEPAVKDAGYRVIRVDLVPHNDWIMNQVMGLIRLAPFVVADFTGHRNGVYFEAGFARGLGKPVVHTCTEKHLREVHFDTAQLFHVLWSDAEELRKKLHHHITGSIGWGPHRPANPAP